MQRAFRWIEWPKVERDSVILCILPPVCLRPSGAVPRWRIYVRNWPVVVWIAHIQPLALEDRTQDGSLLGRRQSSFTDGVVAEDGDERKKEIDKLLQQGCRERVNLTGFRSRGKDEPA